MLSILIPTYNYNIVSLVNNLHNQADLANIDFEIIVIDDGSSDLIIIEENQKETVNLTNVSYTILNKNNGREITRQKLAIRAQYNWLLFIDADTLPKKNTFIKEYIDSIKIGSKLIFGGIAYRNKQPESNSILRWKYGRSREEISVNKRNQNKYLSINSGGFLIDKDLFLHINSQITWEIYGLDILFTYLLQNEKVPVLHIDNPLYHLGLETNEVFLEKSKKAVQTLHFLECKNLISNNYSSLQRTYNSLVKLKLKGVFRLLVRRYMPSIEKRLITKNTALYLIDLVRLFYFTELKSKKSA